jgi:glycosyltransferase involved in cell wall biosynthesis
MKIAFIYDAPYPWHIGGIEAIINNEARELAKENEVHFFSLKWPSMNRHFVNEEIRYHAFHETNQTKLYRHGRRSIREACIFGFGLVRLFGYRFDVVITDAFPFLHLPIIKLYCKISNAKLIIRVDEAWDKKYWKDYLGLFVGALSNVYSDHIIRGADWYIANSGATVEGFRKKGLDQSRISIFAPVIDNALLGGIKKRKREKRIIFSGRFIKEKRIDKLLDVMDRVSRKRKDIKAVIVGKGPEKEEIVKKAKHLKLEGTVRILEFFQKKKDLYNMIASSSVFLQMSEREGLSIITLESLSLGTPVIIPEYSPLPKEIKEMCIQVPENRIADEIIKVAESRDKKRFIRNVKELRIFSTSEIKRFYSDVFENIGLEEES